MQYLFVTPETPAEDTFLLQTHDYLEEKKGMAAFISSCLRPTSLRRRRK